MPLSELDNYNKTAEEPLKKRAQRRGGGRCAISTRAKHSAAGSTRFFYQIGYWEGQPFASAREMRAFLTDNAFRIPALLGTYTSAAQAYRAAMALDEERKKEDYLTDGVVIKIDQTSLREALGTTNRFPRWAMAVKFEAEEAMTTLKDVLWDVGRTGKVTPTAVLEPVELAGATVTRATLNNPGDLRRKGVRLGGGVWIRRSNDVIPEILGRADEKGEEIPIPTHCPFCATTLEMRGALLFCPNRKTCKPQRLYALNHFVSREGMDIQGLSERTLERAMDDLGVVTADGLYDVPVEQWESLEGFAHRRAEKIAEAIQKSKNRPLPNFLYALGIPNVGKRTARALSEAFGSMQALMHASVEQMQDIRDVGPIVARSIWEYFHEEENRAMLARLKAHGIDPVQTPEAQNEAEGRFANQRMVFTGTLHSMARKDAQELARSHGARVADSVTRETTMLVAGEKAGSKLEKAKALGITVLSEQEFLDAIGEKGDGMNIGKLTNEQLQQSVLSMLRPLRGEVVLRPGVGEDCAALDLGNNLCVVSTDPITASKKDLGRLVVHVCCNDAASSGGEPIALLLTLLVPPTSTIHDIENIMLQAYETAKQMRVEIIGGHTEITDGVTRPLVSGMVLASCPRGGLVRSSGGQVGDALVMTKTAGLEGSYIIASDYPQRALDVFGKQGLEACLALKDSISVLPEGLAAARNGAHAMHDVTEGGVLGAVHEMCTASGCGVLIEEMDIPILPETKELCTALRLDPLRLISSGCMLIACADGDGMQAVLKGIGVPSARIGRLAYKADGMRIRCRDGQTRPLGLPREDELYKLTSRHSR